MMSDYNYRDVFVTCPYNASHRMPTSSLQTHIVKCKQDYPNVQKVGCPFNATHLLDSSELNHHLINCPDRGPLDSYMAQTLNQNNPYKGNTSVPAFSDPFVKSEENWDSNLEVASKPIGSTPPPGAIIQPPADAKPSERRRLYRNLIRMNNETENVDQNPVRKQAPRQPNPVQAPKANSTELTDPKTIQNLGLGRGNSRIAANFNNNVSSGISEKSYSNVVKNMGNLSIGRGQSGNQVSTPRLYDGDKDDEFPALGS